MNIIEINKLTHRFADGSLGLNEIDLSIEKGGFVVLAGPNGSGKTTLLRHLNGLLRPSAGEVRINGIPVSKNVKRARQVVGMVFQDADSQIVGETVFDDAAFGPENLGLDRDEVDRRVTEALQAVGLADVADRRPHLLSGGQKRKLAIAGVLAMKSQVIVFDEPFSNLDYIGIRQVLEQILKLHASGHTIVITTHDLEKVLYYADRLVVMDGGQVVCNGVPEKIVPEIERYGVRRPCAVRLGMEVESWLS